MINTLKDRLPHGAGINSEWHFSTSAKYIIASNSYHCMSDNGFYAGWQPFKIKISIDSIVNDTIADDFILQFIGSQHLANKYMLREYLEDTLYFALAG